MNFEFYESLSDHEAANDLERFLVETTPELASMVRTMSDGGIEADFELTSIQSVLDWALDRIVVIRREPDNALPEWIRESATAKSNAFDFDPKSVAMVLSTARYIGECFVRRWPDVLGWSTGRRGTAPQGQPVIQGFANALELPVLLVAENEFGAVLVGTKPRRDLGSAVGWWTKSVPI